MLPGLKFLGLRIGLLEDLFCDVRPSFDGVLILNSFLGSDELECGKGVADEVDVKDAEDCEQDEEDNSDREADPEHNHDCQEGVPVGLTPEHPDPSYVEEAEEHCRAQHYHELRVVLLPDAVVYPQAVVVKPLHAPPANLAVP